MMHGFRTAALVLAAAATLFPAPARAIGRFDIKPVLITFAPGAASASVEIANTGTAAQELEVAVTAWTSSDPAQAVAPSDDIVASPSIFIVAPGQTQLVRLGPARDLSGDVERAYRLVATEVPSATSGSAVQAILRLRLPIFVAPHQTIAPPLVASAVRSGASRLAIGVRNDGNVHRRVRALRVTQAGRVLYDDVVAAYILAHQAREWSIPLGGADPAQPIVVRVLEMDGATVETSLRVR